ncbi:MAG: sulfotransferase family protein [Rhodobacteraceae bacterium]|nr:sulfotransferase family protein [Paracoccaceae bacterium]
MGFPGVWMTESASVMYRVVPKCACSTIGQILYFSDHGRYFDGDIHDARDGLHKWAREDSRPAITEAALGRETFAFTCVRNPYSRILSSFLDKVCGIQRNGNRYRGNLVPMLVARYGVDIGGPDGTRPFDQIASFRRFLLFARDTIRWRRPMDPDIHWSGMAGHAGTFVRNGGRFDRVIHTEDFAAGMGDVLSHIETPHRVDLSAVPRFNESAGHGPRRAHPVAAYFDDLSMHLVHEIYRRDFQIFGYDAEDAGRQHPVAPVDLDALHDALAEGDQ